MKQVINAPERKDFLSPFFIEIEPISRILFINFKKDPDTTYMGFEPQVFDDSVHGKGHLVMGWRNDGKVDVYHESSLSLNPEKYDIVSKGLENMVECKFDVAFFDIKERGVQANYLFSDIYKRKIRIKINESNPKKRKPYGMLAPMGSLAEHPSAMPLILLHDLYFVRRSMTDFEVFIDNVQHKPDKLPIPLDRAGMYFTLYSPGPLIARLNPEYNGIISPIVIKNGIKTYKLGDCIFDFVWQNDNLFMQKITCRNDIYPMVLYFEDPFPDVKSLNDKVLVNGKFTIEGDSSVGTVFGSYSVEKNNGTITTEMRFGGWKPRPTKFSLRFFYMVAGIFKKWPTTYVWNALINQKKDDNYSMTSKWKRI